MTGLLVRFQHIQEFSSKVVLSMKEAKARKGMYNTKWVGSLIKGTSGSSIAWRTPAEFLYWPSITMDWR